MTERTEITRENIKTLITDPVVRQEMEKLIDVTEKLGFRVCLLPSGKRFDIDTGVITGPAVTGDLPLMSEVIAALQQSYWLITASLYYHSEADSTITTNTSLDKAYKLMQKRQDTKAATQKYFKAASSVPCTMEALGDLLLRVDAMREHHLSVCGGDDNGNLLVQYTRDTTYPFDPLTEPTRLNANGGLVGAWSFLVPAQWQLLVALVLYDEDQAKASKNAKA